MSFEVILLSVYKLKLLCLLGELNVFTWSNIYICNNEFCFKVSFVKYFSIRIFNPLTFTVSTNICVAIFHFILCVYLAHMFCPTFIYSLSLRLFSLYQFESITLLFSFSYSQNYNIHPYIVKVYQTLCSLWVLEGP